MLGLSFTDTTEFGSTVLNVFINNYTSQLYNCTLDSAFPVVLCATLCGSDNLRLSLPFIVALSANFVMCYCYNIL